MNKSVFETSQLTTVNPVAKINFRFFKDIFHAYFTYNIPRLFNPKQSHFKNLFNWSNPQYCGMKWISPYFNNLNKRVLCVFCLVMLQLLTILIFIMIINYCIKLYSINDIHLFIKIFRSQEKKNLELYLKWISKNF